MLEHVLTQYYPRPVLSFIKREAKKCREELPLSYYLRIIQGGILKNTKFPDAPDIRLIDKVYDAYRILSNYINRDFSRTEVMAIFWIGMYADLDLMKGAIREAQERGVYSACYVKAILMGRGVKKPLPRKTHISKNYEAKTGFSDVLKETEENKLLDNIRK